MPILKPILVKTMDWILEKTNQHKVANGKVLEKKVNSVTENAYLSRNLTVFIGTFKNIFILHTYIFMKSIHIYCVYIICHYVCS